MGSGSDHTIGALRGELVPHPALQSPPSDLPHWDDDGPKSHEIWFALAAWLLKLPHTHCKAVPVASSLKCVKPNDLGYAARISPSELRESNLTQIYLKSCLVVWIFLRFPKTRIPTSYMLTFCIIPFSVFLLSCTSRALSCSSLRLPLEWHLLCKREDVGQMETQMGRVYVTFQPLSVFAPVKEVDFVPLSSPHS